MACETSYYQDGSACITSARAVLEGRSFAIADVTGVRVTRRPPGRLAGVLVLLASGLPFLAAASIDVNEETKLIWGLCAQIGVALLAVGVHLVARAKPTYHVTLSGASGDTDALKSRDAGYVREIVRAIDRAIVARG